MDALLPPDIFDARLSCKLNRSKDGLDGQEGRASAGSQRKTSFRSRVDSEMNSMKTSPTCRFLSYEKNRQAVLVVKCEECGRAAIDHGLKVKWKKLEKVVGGAASFHASGKDAKKCFPALLTRKVVAIVALLKATRVLVSCQILASKMRVKWLCSLLKGCWQPLAPVSALFERSKDSSRTASALQECLNALEESQFDDIMLIQKLDQALYSLYYDTNAGTWGGRGLVIPTMMSPEEYFEQVVYDWNPHDSLGGLERNFCHSSESILEENALYRLWMARMREHKRIGNWAAGFTKTLRRVPKMDWAGQGRPPLCSSESQSWHDALRDWPAHLFAYAVPYKQALDILARRGSMVEIGAGTGFWAKLLRERGCDLVAADSAPLATRKSQIHGSNMRLVSNEYHGMLPAYTIVLPMNRLGKKKKNNWSMRSEWAHRDCLFLCYPPPGSNMALDTILQFKGKSVAIVGEWCGTTGSAEFEIELNRSFVLRQKVELPNFPNTAYDLTIWERRPVRLTGAVPHLALVCAGCKSPLGVEGTRLFRSALSRSPQSCWCSKSCHDNSSFVEVTELERRGFHLVESDLAQIQTAGGSQDLKKCKWMDEIPWPFYDAKPEEQVCEYIFGVADDKKTNKKKKSSSKTSRVTEDSTSCSSAGKKSKKRGFVAIVLEEELGISKAKAKKKKRKINYKNQRKN